MDGIASGGRHGLFTTYISDATLESPAGQTSDHASLWRFFPSPWIVAIVWSTLSTWDVLQGVDFEPGLDRTSLIGWFAEETMAVP
jgi:hypothetical protein